MHEIRVSVACPEGADYGVAELSVAGESIGYTILEDGDLMLHIEPRRDHAAAVVGVQSLARRSFKPATYSNSTDALLTPHNCRAPYALPPPPDGTSRKDTMKTPVTGGKQLQPVKLMSLAVVGVRSHKQLVWVLPRAGRSDGLINEVVSHLADPIELQRDQQILARKSRSPCQ